VNLAIVTETYPPEVNGVAMTFGRIAGELARRGHEVTVWRPDRSDLSPRALRPGVTEIPVPGFPIPRYPLLRFGLPAWGRLRRAWRARRPDLVHVVTEGPLGASAVTAACALGVPVTSSFHTNFHRYTRDYGFGALGGLALRWLRRVHNRTHLTFAPTTELCSELSAMGFRNLSVLSRGVDTSRFNPAQRSAELRAQWGATADSPVVIHVGRMAPEKNYDLLFRAYAAMRAAVPSLRFVLAGDGPLKAQLVREHPDCIFAGSCTHEELGRHYASADLYIHASLTETFGNVLTEAMASGLAIAGFDYAAARQFVRDGENGLTVQRHEPDQLVAAAVRLAVNAPLRAKLRAAARQELIAQSWENVIARFEDDLLAVVAAHGPSHPSFSFSSAVPAKATTWRPAPPPPDAIAWEAPSEAVSPTSSRSRPGGSAPAPVPAAPA
jgi:glycosyltransferase involved in cell wall biosynthesis